MDPNPLPRFLIYLVLVYEERSLFKPSEMQEKKNSTQIQTDLAVIYLASINIYPLLGLVVFVGIVGLAFGPSVAAVSIGVLIGIIGLFLLMFRYQNGGKLCLVNTRLEDCLVYVMVGERYIGGGMRPVAYYLKSGLRLYAYGDKKVAITRTFLFKSNQVVRFSFNPPKLDVGDEVDDELVMYSGTFIMRKRWTGDVIRFVVDKSAQLGLNSDGRVHTSALSGLLVQEYKAVYRSKQARVQPHRAAQNAVVKAGFDMKFDEKVEE